MSLTMAKLCPDLSHIGAFSRHIEAAAEVSQWYIAYTQPRHEKSVEKHLRMRDIETYLPLHREIRRWNGRSVQVELPLFTSYVFVRLPLSQRLKPLEHRSVVSMVAFGGCIAAIPDSEIGALRNALSKRKSEPYPYFSPGKRVRIHAGPLAGLEGTIVRKKGSLRMIVSVDFLQRSIAVDLEPADLRLAA
jgi:transcription antitermination factor NusG